MRVEGFWDDCDDSPYRSCPNDPLTRGTAASEVVWAEGLED